MEFINFAETGRPPAWEYDQNDKRYLGWEHFEQVSPWVAEHRDSKQLSWNELIDLLYSETGIRISVPTAIRSHEYAHRHETRLRVGIGKLHCKVRLGDDKFGLVRSLIAQGETNGAELARQAGCSRNTANRWKRRVLSETNSITEFVVTKAKA